ncbi:hypothetical protein N9N28_02965 [Rubripirellula amarantea]|nr:hypothetical protein [Rubripirellula amarantea]
MLPTVMKVKRTGIGTIIPAATSEATIGGGGATLFHSEDQIALRLIVSLQQFCAAKVLSQSPKLAGSMRSHY